MSVAANLVREMAYAAAKFVATDDDYWRQQMDYLEGQLAVEVAPTQPTGAEVEYAQRLAWSLHDKFYPEVAGWRPLPDLVGILTQIDNMTAGLQKKPSPPTQKDTI